MALNTFTWAPSLPAKLSRNPKFNSVAYGDGYAQNAPTGINNNPESWDLQFNGLDIATGHAIDDFLTAQNGQPFLWTNSRGVTKPFTCATKWEIDINDDEGASGTATFAEYFGTTS